MVKQYGGESTPSSPRDPAESEGMQTPRNVDNPGGDAASDAGAINIEYTADEGVVWQLDQGLQQKPRHFNLLGDKTMLDTMLDYHASPSDILRKEMFPPTMFQGEQQFSAALDLHRAVIMIAAGKIADNGSPIAELIDELAATIERESTFREQAKETSMRSHFPEKVQDRLYVNYVNAIGFLHTLLREFNGILVQVDYAQNIYAQNLRDESLSEQDRFALLGAQENAFEDIVEVFEKLDASPGVSQSLKEAIKEMMVTHAIHRKYNYFKLTLLDAVEGNNVVSSKDILAELAEFRKSTLEKNQDIKYPGLLTMLQNNYNIGFAGIENDLKNLASADKSIQQQAKRNCLQKLRVDLDIPGQSVMRVASDRSRRDSRLFSSRPQSRSSSRIIQPSYIKSPGGPTW